MNAPRTPPMSFGLRLWFGIILIFMFLSASMMVAGFVAYRGEVNARVAGQCHVIDRTRSALEGIIRLATKPADLTGLDEVRRGVVEEVNRQRLAAREKYLPKINVLSCDSTD